MPLRLDRLKTLLDGHLEATHPLLSGFARRKFLGQVESEEQLLDEVGGLGHGLSFPLAEEGALALWTCGIVEGPGGYLRIYL